MLSKWMVSALVEFIDGIAMDDYLNEEKPSKEYAEELFLQILDAVEEAHDRGIIPSRFKACKRHDATHTQQDDPQSM